MKATRITQNEVEEAAKKLGLFLIRKGIRKIYPIPRGGIPAAYILKAIRPELEIVDHVDQADCCVDDLIDSGKTAAKYSKTVYALFNKGFDFDHNTWLVFPWEHSEEWSAEDIGIRLLQYIGEDPTREGLQETPARFLKAWREWTRGYGADLNSIFKDFGDGGERYDEMIIIDPIPFYSHCEHHMAAIFGTVHLAYIPNGRIAGLSKFCRLVDAFACRLQVQERLTTQIADFINDELKPLGVGVVVRGRHFCMESRGAKKPGAETTTIALRGCIKSEPEARAEFLSIIKGR